MELYGRMMAGDYVMEYSSRSTTYSRSMHIMTHYALLPVMWAHWMKVE